MSQLAERRKIRSLALPRASYFVASDGHTRVRRPWDVFTAVVGLLLIAWALIRNGSTAAWETSLTEFVSASPQWVTGLLSLGYALSVIYAVVVIAAIALGGDDRRSALRDLIAVLVATSGIVVLLSFLINDAWPYVLPEINPDDPVPVFPVMRVALVTAMLVVLTPHVTRPLRRFGWFAIFTTALASVALSYGSPTQTTGSFGVGLFTAGLLLVIVGSPRGYPHPETVAAALTALGVPNRGIEPTAYQSWGVVRFRATGENGVPIDIKVHGRDAFDSELVAKVWHTMWYRETGRTVSYSRLQAVEHEALVTVMAERAGVRVPELAAVGSASPELALISFQRSGVSLAEIDDANQVEDELLESLWLQVGLLHSHGLSHGGLRASAVQIAPDGAVISDFALGSLAADKTARGSDVVELLFSLAALVGEERAVRTALALGHESLASALPYLQIPALSPQTRHLVEEPKKLMSKLQSLLVEATESEAPEPMQLRRVTPRSLIMGALLVLMGSAILPFFTGIDYAEIWGVLVSADWALLLGAFLFGHTQFFPQATATMFAVPAALPFWPLLTLQAASQFISLAIPAAVGRVAMNAAFLRRFGVSVTVALAQGAIDGFSGFLVQVALLILLLLVGDVDLGYDVDTSDINWLLVLGVLAIISVAVVLVVLRVQKLREKVVPVVSQAWGALMVVLKEPMRGIGLLGSNFVYWNVLGITLWLLLQAVGVDLNYGSALFVACGTSLLAGFMPVPGGIGVAEATMVALLSALGVDESAAFAVTMTYRVITFYLPALEGFFCARWLERNDYI